MAPEPDPTPVQPDPAPMQPDPAPMQPDPAPMQPDPAPTQPMRSDACRESEALQIAALAHELDANGASTPLLGAVDAGRIAFNSRQPDGLIGNGRACSDCHMNASSFQLTPAMAAARFAALQACRADDPSWDDPLFRAVDADDFRQRGDAAQDFTNLTQNGLVRVTLPLPPNVRLIDPATDRPSDETEAEVFRAVPTIFDLALSGPDGRNPWPRGPNPAGGYQLDARVATLEEQARAALRGHSNIAAELPSTLIDAISAFERSEFSSPRVRELSDALRAGSSELPDTTPPLDGLALAGKAVFERACATCHGGPTHTSNEPPADRYSNIVSACPRPVDTQSPPRWSFKVCPPNLTRNVRRYEITRGDGQIERRDSSDPGRALLTGVIGDNPPADDWGALDVPSLFAISRTAPYFHNNSAASLDDVLDHYSAFFALLEATIPIDVCGKVVSTDGQSFDRKFTPEERPALRAYLDRL